MSINSKKRIHCQAVGEGTTDEIPIYTDKKTASSNGDKSLIVKSQANGPPRSPPGHFQEVFRGLGTKNRVEIANRYGRD